MAGLPAIATMPLRLYARIGDSGGLTEIGEVQMEMEATFDPKKGIALAPGVLRENVADALISAAAEIRNSGDGDEDDDEDEE